MLDTNVFVSATLSKNPASPTREVPERWQRGEFVLLICTPLAEEIVEKLLDHNISAERTDPDDNVIVACAVEGSANYLVTYDPHFDVLGGEYRGMKTLKAIPFLEILRGSGE